MFIGIEHEHICLRQKEEICENRKNVSLLTIKLINPVVIHVERELIYLTNIADSVDIQGNCSEIGSG